VKGKLNMFMTAAGNIRKPHNMRIGNKEFEGVSELKYLGNIIENNNRNDMIKATNTIFHQLTRKPKKEKPPGIYRISCVTCKKAYVGQTGRYITTRYKEHIRYIRHNNLISAYSMHIINNRHEFGPHESTLSLLKQCQKCPIMNTREAMYIQATSHQNLLVAEQNSTEYNTMFKLARIPPPLTLQQSSITQSQNNTNPITSTKTSNTRKAKSNLTY
jgi:hypothetical protein